MTSDAPVACFTENDVQIRLVVAYPRDEIQRHHARGEFYEAEELEIISRHFPKGGIYCDIGANVGNHAIYVGKMLDPSKIFVFEPNPAAIQVLISNIVLNELDAITDSSHLGLGLSDQSGEGFDITFRRPRWHVKNLGGAQLERNGGDITVARGDALLGRQKVDFIKIDVEGMEMKVLTGLEQTIKASRPILFVEVDQVNAAEMEAWVKANRYNVTERFSRYDSNENYLCTPKTQQEPILP